MKFIPHATLPWNTPPRLALALVISLLALFLRGYLAAVGPVEYDEPVYVDGAVLYSSAARDGQWQQITASTYNIEHPIFTKLLYAEALLPFKRMVGPSMPIGTPLHALPNYSKLLALRMVSVVAGTGAVFLLSLINPLAGLALALHTFAIKYSSVVYLEAVPLLASLGALLVMQRAFVQRERAFAECERAFGPRGQGGRPALAWLALGAALVGAAAASKYMYGVIALAIGLGIVLRPDGRNWKTLLWLAAWAGACAAFFLLFDPLLWPSPVARLRESLSFSVNYSAGDAVVVRKAYPFWQPVAWLLLSIPHHTQELQPFFVQPGDYFVLADSLIFVLALLGLPRLFRRDLGMALWLVMAVGFLLVWRTKWPQYTMLMLPPVCLSAAFGAGLLKDAYHNLRARGSGPHHLPDEAP